jgi:hypothetical protein
MTPEISAHLSPEQINDCLIGLSSAESAAHLAQCAQCRRQVNEFQSQMKSFNQTTLAWSESRTVARSESWSEARSEARPQSASFAHPSQNRQAIGTPLSWALAAALVVAIGLPVWHHHQDVASNHPTRQVSTQEETGAQIAQDNDLLRAVNVALNQGEESPVREYHLSEAPRSHLRKRPELRK